MEPVEDDRYDASADQSIVDLDDTRKTRLTLRDINRARRAEDMHRQESQKDLDHIRAMYGITANTPDEGI